MGTEHCIYFGDEPWRMFGVLHEPAMEPGGEPLAWVVCSPLGQERGNSHRVLVEWSRVLAGRGHWVFRFDYRGTGDSAGRQEDFTVDDHVQDTVRAIRELERLSGTVCSGLCGLRFGATVAALTAIQRAGPARLILWEPVPQGRAYVDSLLRLVLAREMTRKEGPGRTRSNLYDDLSAGALLLADGQPVTSRIADSFVAVDLNAAPVPEGPVLITRIRPASEANRPNDPLRILCDRYQAHGGAQISSAELPAFWTLTKELVSHPLGLFGPALTWIESTTRPPVHARYREVETTRKMRCDRQVKNDCCSKRTVIHDGDRPCHYPAFEEAVEFPHQDCVLRGILHLPPGEPGNRPALLMPPPGTDNRSGHLRLYVRLARYFARAGWPVLRVDPSGVGDSEGVLSVVSRAGHSLAVQKGLYVADMRAATTFLLSRLGSPGVIEMGICGGGITASLHAAEDTRVLGIAPIEIQLRYAALPGGKSGDPLWAYAHRMYSPNRWLRFLTLQSSYRSVARALFDAAARSIRRGEPVSNAEILLERMGPRANLPLVQTLQRCAERPMPILLIFGSTDDLLFYEETKDVLFGSISDSTTRVREHIVEGADHAFSLPPHFTELQQVVLRWLEDPDHPWADDARKEVLPRFDSASTR
ncbi:MAG: alpha/beta hydrolase [Candidatus Hydrogenedentes bacterium]|nr:alpha/beta hydrolase [Candidatus Hydrogenedentota bacterium]